MRSTALLVTLLIGLLGNQAVAQTLLRLLSIPITDTCLVQNQDQASSYFQAERVQKQRERLRAREYVEKNKDTPEYKEFARMFKLEPLKEQDPDPDPELVFKSQFANSTWAMCVNRRQWLSKELCRDFVESQTNARLFDLPWDVQAVTEKHKMEISQHARVFKYFDQSFSSGRDESPNLPCPE